jgi:hypothetical protein
VTPTLTEENDGNGNPDGMLDINVTASVAAHLLHEHIQRSSVTVTASGYLQPARIGG